ncbi:uncharacterized protein OCT59_021059 [Rhizophagus irregularis]|uniref:uncharacterized protein n=1 Tax=Rhizophagus irregularis TaxID=588596 RepID=UPI00331FADC9|nr:hypothetical protein OCT59_021059 [Rhizophagus irregularis]
MRKSRLSITKPFSLRESINFSGRNILQRHRHLGSYNKEGSEAELQDKMEVESDNYHNDDDVSIEEDNDHYSEHYSEADNYIGEEDNDNYSEEADDYSEKTDDYGEETDDNYIEEEDDNYGEEDDNNNENVYYDDSDNIIDNNDNVSSNLLLGFEVVGGSISSIPFLRNELLLNFPSLVIYEEKIVDSSIDSDQMSKINGSFAPYFENLTSALLFCWVQKHNISTNAYNDLVEILQHQKFEVKDVVKNIRSSSYISLYLEIYCPNEFIIYKENGKRRFGQIRSIVSINDELRIKIQRICTYYELPNNFHSNVRSITSESQLWLIDQHLEEGSIIANTYEIIEKVDITIVRGSTIIANGLFIKEILYKNNGHWKLRDVALDYMHPCEYSALNSPPSPDCWIVAGLGCVTTDLPQGNDLTGVKRHGAIRGCRTCLAKENATDTTLDIASISRYHHITNIQFKNIFTATTLENRNNIAKEYGLRTSLPILDQLQRERHLQSPQDIYHIIAGKTLKLLKLTTAMLSLEGELIFIEEWKSFEYPKQWSKLLNPISHLESFMMSDRVRLEMVMPFILNRSLTINSLKQQEMDKLQRRTKLNHNQVINTIVKCWAIVAKCSRLAFKFSLTIDDYIELERYLKKEREALVEVKYSLY